MMKKIVPMLFSVLLLSSCIPQASNPSTNTPTNTDGTGTSSSGTSTPGGTNSTAEKTQLTWHTFWGSETRQPIVDEIVTTFNKSQDEIEVTHVFVPWGDIWTKNKAAIAAGNPVDVIVNDVNSVANRASSGEVEDLSVFIENDPDISEDDYYEQYMDAMKYEGKIYGIPYAVDNRIIYYNKRLFKEAGLDPESPPKTWAELQEAAFKLDQKKDDSFDVIGFYPLFGNGGYDTWMVNADQGKTFYDSEADKVIINTPAKKRALEYIGSYTDHYGKSNIDAFQGAFGSGMQDPFISEKLAMMTQTPAFNNVIKNNKPDIEFGVFPIPEMEPGNGNWSGGGGFNVEIPKGAKNPEASFKFIKFLVSEEGQKIWSSKNFELSTLKSLAEDEELMADPVYKLSTDLLQQTSLGVYPMYFLGYNDYFNPVMDDFTAGNLSAQEAIEKAQTEVENFVETNR